MSHSVAIRSSELKSRPSDAEVEEMYDRVMAALLLPENVVKQLKETETIEAKWQKVMMNTKLVESSASSTKFGEDDAAEMNELRRTAARPSIKKLAVLRDKLSTGSRGLLDGFYRRDGLDLLATLLWAMSDGLGASYTELEATCTLITYQCVKALANHRSGLEQIVGHVELLTAIAETALRDVGSAIGGAVAVLGLELLAVSAHFGYSDAVSSKALQAETDKNNKDDPIARLRKAFLGRHHNGNFSVSPATAAAGLTLANELIHAEKTDTVRRNQLRSYAKPLFEEIRVDGPTQAATKKNIDRHATDMDGSLLATKQNVKNVARAFGVQTIKRRDFWLRDGRLWWHSGGDEAISAVSESNSSPIKKKPTGQRRGSLFGGGHTKAISSPKQDYPSDDSESYCSSSLPIAPGSSSNSRSIDLFSVDSIHASSYEKNIKEETPFAFELVLTSGKTIAYGTSSQVERRAWLEALRRAKDRVDVSRELVELARTDDSINSALNSRRGSNLSAMNESVDDDKAFQLIWNFVMRAIGTAEHRADDVLTAQRRTYERMAETDRIEALAENDGLDLTDLRSLTSQLTAAAATDPGIEAKLIELLGGTLKRLRAGAPLESTPLALQPDTEILVKADSPKNGSPKKVRLPPPLPTSPPPALPAQIRPVSAKQESPKEKKEEADPRLAKFFKMAKLHVPIEAIRIKMKAEGLDPSLLEESQQPARATVEVNLPEAKQSEAAPSGPIAKYQKMLKMHIPLMAIQNKMRAEGLDPNLLQQTDGATDTGLPVAMMPVRSRSSSRLSARRPGSVRSIRIFGEPPHVPMRPWFWTPLRGEKETTSGVWAMAQTSLISLQTKLDIKGLESAFAKTQTPSISTTKASTSTPVTRRFVDPRIEQNCGIVLAKLRLPVRELAAAVARGDVSIVTGANAELLKHAIPSDEDAAAALERDDLETKADDGSATDASLVEIWFRSCASIPRYRDRVDALRLRHNLDQLALELEAALNSVTSAADAVVQHTDLALGLSACLAIGNYLNGASVRGDAKAFSLSGLGRLSTTKGADGSTLAQHVATVLTKTDPDAIDRLYMLKTTLLDPAAAANCPGTWDNELSELDLRLTRLERLIKDDEQAIAEAGNPMALYGRSKNARPQLAKSASHLDAIAESDDDDNDEVEEPVKASPAIDDDEEEEDEHAERKAFLHTVKPFAAVARLRISVIKESRQGLNAKLQVCADAFGEASASPKELFEDYLGGFIRALKTGQQANSRREEEEASRRKREARRGSAAPKNRPSDGGLFESFQRSQLENLERRRASLAPSPTDSFDD